MGVGAGPYEFTINNIDDDTTFTVTLSDKIADINNNPLAETIYQYYGSDAYVINGGGGSGDFGDIVVLFSKSTDNGDNWSVPVTVQAAESMKLMDLGIAAYLSKVYLISYANSPVNEYRIYRSDDDGGAFNLVSFIDNWGGGDNFGWVLAPPI